MSRGQTPAILIQTATFGSAGLGGMLAIVLGVPMPWLIGPLCTTIALSLAGARLEIDPRLRDVMLAVLGVLVGSAFTPSIIGHVGRWLPSLLALAPLVALCGILLAAGLRRFAGYDRVTAWFAAMPGGLSEMVMIGRAHGGDDRTLTLIHSVRILVVVIALPFGFSVFGGSHLSAERVAAPFPGLWDTLVLLGCVVIGMPLGRVLRLPAPAMIGPMILSAVAHMSGVSSVTPPTVIVAAAQVIVGASLGSRFSGYGVSSAFKTVAIGVVLTIGMLVLGAVFVAGLHYATGIDVLMLVLAYAPGGVAELSLIALFLGIDAAFVSVHHLVRIVIVVAIGPALFRLLNHRARKDRSRV